MRVLALNGSPRHAGNSATLLQAFCEGARGAGHDVDLAHLDDHLTSFLRDCKACRDASGNCTLADGFGTLFLDRFLPAEAVAFATPIYWYGMSGLLKTFLDRMFCYCAASYPDSPRVIEGMLRKRFVLLLSSEESYAGAELGIVHQMQEIARYTHSDLAAVVRGVGNRRGEVARDPLSPIESARRAGARLQDLRHTDYRIDTERSMTVWPQS